MNILLDTHFLIWAFTDSKKIDSKIEVLLQDDRNDIYYSPVSLWEIAIKFGKGSLVLSGGTPEDLFAEIDSSFLLCTDLDVKDIVSSYRLPREHHDPFDRLLCWQAIQQQYHLLTNDRKLAFYQSFGLQLIL